MFTITVTEQVNGETIEVFRTTRPKIDTLGVIAAVMKEPRRTRRDKGTQRTRQDASNGFPELPIQNQ